MATKERSRRASSVAWSERGLAPMQLFQRRRWVDPGRLAEGLAAFVQQLVWINEHTGLEMAAWRRTDGHHRGATLATTTYDDHGWFLAEVARLQTLVDYGPINEATAAVTVGEDAFERWDAPPDTPADWLPGWSFLLQITAPEETPAWPSQGWTNAEGADGRITWLLDGEWPADNLPADGVSGARQERWTRIH